MATPGNSAESPRGAGWEPYETALVVSVAYNNAHKKLQEISDTCHELDRTFSRPGAAVRKKIKRLIKGRSWSSLKVDERRRLLKKAEVDLNLQDIIKNDPEPQYCQTTSLTYVGTGEASKHYFSNYESEFQLSDFQPSFVEVPGGFVEPRVRSGSCDEMDLDVLMDVVEALS